MVDRQFGDASNGRYRAQHAPVRRIVNMTALTVAEANLARSEE